MLFVGTVKEFIFVSFGGGADLKIGPLPLGKGGILRIPATGITSLVVGKKSPVKVELVPPDVYTMKYGKDGGEIDFFAQPGEPLVDSVALKAFLEPFLK